MRKVMPRELKRIGLVTRCHQRQVRVTIERTHDIAQLAVNPRRNRRLGKTGSDGCRDVRRGGSPRDFSGRAIGKGDADHLGHGETLLSARICRAPLPVRRACRKRRRFAFYLQAAQPPGRCA